LILPIPEKVVLHPQKNKLNRRSLPVFPHIPHLSFLLSLSSTLERPSARIGLSALTQRSQKYTLEAHLSLALPKPEVGTGICSISVNNRKVSFFRNCDD
jgi:hypothetical protein